MGNWLSAEPGMSPADIDHNPSGQRDDNRRGGEEAVEKGRNRTAVEGYSGARPWGLKAKDDNFAVRPVIDQQLTGATLLPSTYDHTPATAPYTNVVSKTPYQTPSLFSAIHPIDSAYRTGLTAASYCLETAPTFVTARKTPVSFGLIFGIDWMKNQGCVFDCVGRKVQVRGEWIPLQREPASTEVRRIYMSDDVELPPMQ